jgi:hypothetical protein
MTVTKNIDKTLELFKAFTDATVSLSSTDGSNKS